MVTTESFAVLKYHPITHIKTGPAAFLAVHPPNRTFPSNLFHLFVRRRMLIGGGHTSVKERQAPKKEMGKEAALTYMQPGY